MAKDKLEDWDEVAANNLDMGGISLAENVMRPPAVNNEMREHMAQVSKWLGDDTVVAAATTDIGALPGRYVTVTGNTGITSFGTIKAGTVKYLKFTGTPTITYNATSMMLPGLASRTVAAGDKAIFVSEGSGNWNCVAYQKVDGLPVVNPAAPAPLKGHIFGLTLSNNVTDATNDIDIATGEAASDAATPVLLTQASALTKRLDAAWAVGTGSGGLDTGSIANTTYHVWLIQRSDTGVVDALFSVSATAPTMPTNYDRKRRIGSVIRVGGALLAFKQTGDEFALNVGVGDVDITSPGTAAVLRALTVPLGVSVVAYGNMLIINSGSATNGHLLTDPVVSAPTLSQSNPGLMDVYASASAVGSVEFTCRTNTSAQVRSQNFSANADTVRITTRGWIDTRGKN